MGDRVALTAICLNIVKSTRLPNNASIFRAELQNFVDGPPTAMLYM